MKNIIQKALAKISKKAAKYNEKQDANFVAYWNTEGDMLIFQPSIDETFCEDCIELAIIKVKQNKDLILPSDFESFTWETETSKEGEDFCICSKCGEIIHQDIIVTGNETWHWINMSDADFEEALTEPLDCFQLLGILTSGEGEEIKNIAFRVVNTKSAKQYKNGN